MKQNICGMHRRELVRLIRVHIHISKLKVRLLQALSGTREPNQKFTFKLWFLASPTHRSYLNLYSLRQGNFYDF
jgi:hypothetical protein